MRTRAAVQAELERRDWEKRVTRCAHCGRVIDSIEDYGILGVSAGREHVDGGLGSYLICSHCVKGRCIDVLHDGQMNVIDRRCLEFEGFDFNVNGFQRPETILFRVSGPNCRPVGSTYEAFRKAVACRANVGLDLYCGVCELPIGPDQARFMFAVATGETARDGLVLTAGVMCADCLRGSVWDAEAEARTEVTIRPKFWANPGKFSEYPRRVDCVAS